MAPSPVLDPAGCQAQRFPSCARRESHPIASVIWEAFVPDDPEDPGGEAWVWAQESAGPPLPTTDQVGEAVADTAFVLAFVGLDR